MNDPKNRTKRRRPWNTDAAWSRLRTRIDESRIDESRIDAWRMGESNSEQSAPVDPFSIRPNRWRRNTVAAVAACAAIATVFIARERLSMAPASIEWITVATVAGQRDTVQLSDSTTITLAPSTTVRYALTATRREVQLDGMANFEVVHIANRPFNVRVKNADVTDIGTEFAIRAYPSDSVVTVSVMSGVVSLRDTVAASKAQAITLAAGNVGQVSRSGAVQLVHNIGAATNVTWRNGQLFFENLPLREVATELSRWFGVTVRVPDSALAARRVTAIYSSSRVLDVMSALAATLDARAERVGDTITIRGVRR